MGLLYFYLLLLRHRGEGNYIFSHFLKFASSTTSIDKPLAPSGYGATWVPKVSGPSEGEKISAQERN